MKRRTRIYYTPEQKAIIWDRYKQGDSLHDIARMFDRYHSSVMPTIHQTGGYHRPLMRKRHRLALSSSESANRCRFRTGGREVLPVELTTQSGLTVAKNECNIWVDSSLFPGQCQ